MESSKDNGARMKEKIEKHVDRFELENGKFVDVHYLSKNYWDSFNLKAQLVCPRCQWTIDSEPLDEHDEDFIARRVKGFLWRHAEGEYKFEWYASWWQELRVKILPKWWLLRYPSKYETKRRIKAFASYPTLKLATDAYDNKPSCKDCDEGKVGCDTTKYPFTDRP